MDYCKYIQFTPTERKQIIQYLKQKSGGGLRRVSQLTGIPKSTLNLIEHGYNPKRLNIDEKLCRALSPYEIGTIIDRSKLLEKSGIIRHGVINPVFLTLLIDTLLEIPEARHIITEIVLKKMKKEIREALSHILPDTHLKWDSGFESYLLHHKKKPISPGTLRDYKNIWMNCLEGETLNEKIIRSVLKPKIKCEKGEYSTGWLRQILRHYISYLYINGKLDFDTYTRLLMSLPGRKYMKKVSLKPITTRQVVDTLQKLYVSRPAVYTIYLLILYSGVRFTHVLKGLKTWSPSQELYVSYLNRNIKRLECLNGHCRYYLGMEESIKPEAFMYFPSSLLPRIHEVKDKIPSRRTIEKLYPKLGVLPAKMIRSYSIRMMRKILGDNDTYRFIIGKFAELSVSSRHYTDLLEEADSEYPKYMDYISKILKNNELVF